MSEEKKEPVEAEVARAVDSEPPAAAPVAEAPAQPGRLGPRWQMPPRDADKAR
jgi:hypothetical protein